MVHETALQFNTIYFRDTLVRWPTIYSGVHVP